jgi:pimeloyl-ACP methyl ester carboxylesterase
LAGDTTACWHDRAGSGWSDPGPYPRDSAAQARDLHALLLAAGVPPPYVLVAEFSASSDARVYTGFYPAEVAGMVLVNGVDPDFSIRARPGGGRMARSLPAAIGQSEDAMAHLFNDLGLYRLGLPERPAPSPPPRENDRVRVDYRLASD